MTNEPRHFELDECAQHVARLYLIEPRETRPFVSDLAMQIRNYRDRPGNRAALRPMILSSCDLIRTAVDAEEC